MLRARFPRAATRDFGRSAQQLTLVSAKWTGEGRKLTVQAPRSFAQTRGTMQVFMQLENGTDKRRRIDIAFDSAAQLVLSLPQVDVVREIRLQAQVQQPRKVGFLTLGGTFKHAGGNDASRAAAATNSTARRGTASSQGIMFYAASKIVEADRTEALNDWVAEGAASEWYSFQNGKLVIAREGYHTLRCVVQIVHNSSEEDEELDIQLLLKRGERVVAQADTCQIVQQNAITRTQLCLQYGGAFTGDAGDHLTLSVVNDSASPVRVLGHPYSTLVLH